MNDISVSKDGVIKLLKGLNPSKALGPDGLHPRVLKELATELGPVFAHLFQQSIDIGEIPKERSLANTKEKYFNGHSDTRSVQENFDLLTSFIQDSADKHIPSKTSRSVSSVPWITPEIRRKIRRKNKTHAKAKKTGSSKLRSKFETLRREIKADERKQHDLYVNNLLVMLRQTPETSIATSIVRKKTPKVFHLWKGRMERVCSVGSRKGRGI